MVHLSLLFLCSLLLARASAAPEKWSYHEEENPPGTWTNHGGDLYNRRYAKRETLISPRTASNLRLKWQFYAGADVTATPAISDGMVYFPSWNGYIYAVCEGDGTLVWKKSLQELTGFNATGLVQKVNVTVARATPVIAKELLIIGIYGPAVVIAVKRATGELVWSTQLDEHPAGVVTMSGTFYKGAFYVGTSSLEEGRSIEECCLFRGSFAKLDAKTGNILWQTFMLPDNHGRLGEYAGAAVWGSSPPIDKKRNLVFIGTGNLYSAPLRVRNCQEAENNQTTVPTHLDTCVEPDNHSESIIALDLNSGKIKWNHQLGGYDVWFFACNNISSSPNCPPGPNPDADFGEAPMMLTVKVNGTKRDIVVVVQKSGFAWSLDRDNGTIIWSTEAGPGGLGGGGTWGAATDKKRIYTNIANSDRVNFTILPSNEISIAGGWVAMNATTGKIIWSVANPGNSTANGPVTVANGVLLAGSTQGKGPVYAIEAETGDILWTRKTGASVFGGMSVSKGCIFFGNGYTVGLGIFSPSNTAGTSLYAYCVV